MKLEKNDDIDGINNNLKSTFKNFAKKRQSKNGLLWHKFKPQQQQTIQETKTQTQVIQIQHRTWNPIQFKFIELETNNWDKTVTIRIYMIKQWSLHKNNIKK